MEQYERVDNQRSIEAVWLVISTNRLEVWFLVLKLFF